MIQWIKYTFFFLLFSMVNLQAVGAITAISHEKYESPQALVRETSNAVLSVLQERKDEFKEKPYEVCMLVDEVVIVHFDFESMSRWVLGKYWREADESEKQRFIKEFRELLVRTYSTALLEYSDRPITFLPFFSSEDAEKVIVRTSVELKSGHVAPIHYRLHKVGGEWKVYDVVIEGVSIVTNYRRSFINDMRLGGVERLIQRLSDRNKELRGIRQASLKAKEKK